MEQPLNKKNTRIIINYATAILLEHNGVASVVQLRTINSNLINKDNNLKVKIILFLLFLNLMRFI